MNQERNMTAIKMVLRHYFKCMRANWKIILPALLLPGIGSIFVLYVPPLFIAKILTQYSGSGTVTGKVWHYVAWLAAAWMLGEIFWRVGMIYLAKADAIGMRQLYLKAMDYLL